MKIKIEYIIGDPITYNNVVSIRTDGKRFVSIQLHKLVWKRIMHRRIKKITITY